MKQILLLTTCFIIAHTAMAQDFYKLKDVEFKTGSETKAYDSAALQSANYILTSPRDNANSLYATSFLLNWMTATPDFTFTFSGPIVKLGDKSDVLTGVYVAAMTKYCMENKDKASDQNEVAINTYHLLAQYCANPAYGVKQEKDVKKLIEADKNGTLKAYLNIK